MHIHPLEIKLLKSPLSAFDEFNREYVLPLAKKDPLINQQIAEVRACLENYRIQGKCSRIGQSQLVYQYMLDMALHHLHGNHF